MGVICFNPDRIQGGLDIIEKYKDPDTNFLDVNNPDYIAEINAHNQKYDELEKDADYVAKIKGELQETNKKIIEQQQEQQQQEQQQQEQQQQQQEQQQEDSGALANIGADDGQDTQQKMLYGGDYSLENYAGGQPKLLYFTGSDGKSYVKRYAEDEYVYGGPPDGVTLQLTSIIAERNDENFVKKVDPTKFNYGGKFTPEQYEQMTIQANKDDPSDNDVFYDVTDPVTGETTTYVDVTGTGQSIPVGATNITRDPTQLGGFDDQGNPVKYDPSTYTQPVLTKTFQGYEPVTGMYSDVEGITPEQYANLSNQEKLKLAQSDVPTASTDFKDFFDMGSGQFDLGGFFGMDIDPTTGTSGLVLSNPPSNQFNLEKFFNQTEAMGTQNFLRSQSTDALQIQPT
jgi:hypothetical protein